MQLYVLYKAYNLHNFEEFKYSYAFLAKSLGLKSQKNSPNKVLSRLTQNNF